MQCLIFFSGLKLESNGRKRSCHILIGTLRYITEKMRTFMTIFSYWHCEMIHFQRNVMRYNWFLFILGVSFCKIHIESPFQGLKVNCYWYNLSNGHRHKVSRWKNNILTQFHGTKQAGPANQPFHQHHVLNSKIA